MGAFNWLNRLRKSESGNIMALGAAAMPLLVGSAALAVDTVQLSLWKRQLQRSADSAAVAGAYALSQRRNNAQIRTSVENDLADNTHPPLVPGTTIVTPGPRGTHTRAVYVSLTAQKKLPFMSMFTKDVAPIKADAAAALVSQGKYCMVSLYNGTDPGITLGGNSTVRLGCGMITNSQAASAVTTGGTQSYIEATPVGAVGGLNGADNNFRGETELLPYTAPQGDPFGGVPNPTPCTPTGPLEVDGPFLAPLNACYSSVLVKPSGSLTIPQGGTFTVYGGNMDIKGDVQMATGTGGVTIILTGPETSPGSGQVTAGTLEMESQANLSLKAPESGDYADILFYRDRRAAASTFKIRGGAASRLEGAFYAATSDMDLAGNSGFDAECLMMVGQKIAFTGTADLVNECDDDSTVTPINRNVVRLVE